MPHEEAIFAGGCFWCTEAVFGQLKGVQSVESGYIGGAIENPTYKQAGQRYRNTVSLRNFPVGR